MSVKSVPHGISLYITLTEYSLLSFHTKSVSVVVLSSDQCPVGART